MQTTPSLAELVQVHECLRVEAHELRELSTRLLENLGQGKEVKQAIDAVIAKFDFLRVVYDSHSKAEDDAILPALLNRGLSDEVMHEISGEHAGHVGQFNSIAEILKPFRGNMQFVPQNVYQNLTQIEEQVDQLNSSLFLHLRHEEEELFPVLETKFSPQELVALVGQILGDRSSEVLCKHLAMINRDLKEEDKNKVFENMRSASNGTNFENWLSSITKQDLSNAVMGDCKCPDSPETEPLAHITQTSSCQHYRRRCDIFAKCCERYYPCRLCHDDDAAKRTAHGDVAWHTLDRASIDMVRCRLCSTEQQVGERCIQCNVQFGKYFCSICRLYEDDPNKSIYHCPYCNVCRRGKGLGIDFFHCMKCNACISTEFRKHECVDHTLEANCSICGEDLFTSSKPLAKPQLCGHIMHRECLSQYITHGFKCPTCRKSVVDMSTTWKELDSTSQLLDQPVSVKCSDCLKEGFTSIVHMRFALGKCSHCGSYNTFKTNR